MRLCSLRTSFCQPCWALLNPKLGSFDVTAKGGVVNRSYFDRRIAQPFLLMLLLNFLGILMAVPRYFPIPYLGFLWDGTHPGTIIMNLIWTCFNIVILGVATAVAWESQQRRSTVRVAMSVPADVVLADGTVVQGVTADLSSGGVMMSIDRSFTALPGEAVATRLSCARWRCNPAGDGDQCIGRQPARAGSIRSRSRKKKR